MADIRVLVVSPNFYPATRWGGPVIALHGLCRELSNEAELRVLTTDARGPSVSDRLSAAEQAAITNFPVVYARRIAGMSVSWEFLRRLPELVRWADVVYLNYVYSFTTLPTLIACAAFRKPLLWAPRGALQRWHGSRLRLLKRVWEACCNLLLSPDRCWLHVTSAAEARESSRRMPRASLFELPHGIEIPNDLRPTAPQPRQLMYLGRLDVKKGIENLIRAVALLDASYQLHVYGDGDEAYSASLLSLVDRLSLEGRVVFHGHVDGAHKTAAFHAACLCIVPSHTENFCLVVAEALAHGTPVIASTGTPWAELEERRCGYWVDNSPESLAAAIERAMGQDLALMGQAGRQWMVDEFAWKRRATQLLRHLQQIGLPRTPKQNV